jgi:hypothetical protein
LRQLIFLIATLLTTALTAKCQNSLQGKWYFFSRNRIVQLNITKDTLTNQQLNWDLTLRNPYKKPEIQIIDKQVTANENIYLYHTNPKDTLKRISLSTIKIIHPEKELIIAFNATDTSFTDTSLARQYILKDVDKKYGLTFFSESEIQRLRKQKNIDKMTVQDFKLYVDKVLVFRTELDSLSKLPHSPNGLLYYAYSMMRIIIGELGYNPLVTDSEFEMFMQHFQNDPQTKELYDKL